MERVLGNGRPSLTLHAMPGNESRSTTACKHSRDRQTCLPSSSVGNEHVGEEPLAPLARLSSDPTKDACRCLSAFRIKRARLVDPSHAVAHPMHLNVPVARSASVFATPAEVVGAKPRTAGTVRFRPCIDLHKGKVKQIVGSTLQDPAPGGLPGSPLITNFESEFPSSFYAELYKHSNLPGGHVVMLGADDKSRQAAFLALLHFPGGLQVGGGVTLDNAARYLDAGASHVIVTSYVFRDGRLDEERLQALEQMVGKEHLVLDLSCRKRDGHYFVVTDRWQRFSDMQLSELTLASLATSCDEFLVHGVDVEGKKLGIDEELVSLLGQWSPIPVTYAGGARTLDDLERVRTAGDGRVDITVGSALDIFGGDLAFQAVVDWHRQQQQQ